MTVTTFASKKGDSMSYDLKELQRLETEASLGPWDWDPSDYDGTLLLDGSNAALVVALRNAAPALLERMAKLEALLAACQRQGADRSVAGVICFGREVRDALDALTTKEPR